MELSYGQIERRKAGAMNIKDVFGFVDPRVSHAAVQVAEHLKKLGIRFALAGGLAVGVHGYVRATKDVDFLVGEEAFEHHGLLVTFKTGVPIQMDGIQVDYLSALSLGKHLINDLEHPSICDGLPVEVYRLQQPITRKNRADAFLRHLCQSRFSFVLYFYTFLRLIFYYFL